MTNPFRNDVEFSLGKSNEQRILIAIAYAPLGKSGRDLQGEYVDSIEELEKGVHSFMQNGATLKLNHQSTISPDRASVVEAHVAHESTTLNGKRIPRGAFILKIKVHDDDLWQEIKGEPKRWKALSIGGRSARDNDGRLHSLEISEVSLVSRGAFQGENIIALKSATPVTKQEATSKLAEILRELAEVRRMVARQNEPPPVPLSFEENQILEDREDIERDRSTASRYQRIAEETKNYAAMNRRFMPTL